MKVEVRLQVYTQRMVRSDKFKTGKEQYVDKAVCREIREEIPIGTLPVMVNSDLCWLKKAKQGVCYFDNRGYVLIKAAEKVKNLCSSFQHIIIAYGILLHALKLRLRLASNTSWMALYLHAFKRKRVHVKLVDPKSDNIGGGKKILTVYFFGMEIPIWILFFVLGASSDKEVVNLIDKSCRFPPAESDCINKYLFSGLRGFKKKVRVLAYMMKCLLQAYTGRKKVDNRDDFRNKRLELAGQLLER
ncbi:hypothetical protein POM88_051376 [Heracleum sosnowskyi]|uniref:DNA-directed RNA polymerase n=1 Tax=Heracleum sosnowskyi TaxID=360622 RepID=A0AAD8H1T6_9APIA|nr:hypothetical protein POM88_051376 [Heracleum sosnowskyi]